MKTLVFEALRSGGSGQRLPGDINIKMSPEATGRTSLHVRFSSETVDRLRWRRGDQVTFTVDIDEDGQLWRFSRHDEKSKNTLTLSGSTNSTTLTVKRTLTPELAADLFPHGTDRLAGYLTSGDMKAARFKVSYEGQGD